jgi:hypothetical protein
VKSISHVIGYVSKKLKRSKSTRSRIPTFKTIEDEAAFWDAHSSEEFADELIPHEA